MVKAAIHEADGRQPEFFTRVRPVRDTSLRVVSLITGQVDDLFCIGFAVFPRNDGAVGNEVVDIRRPHRSKIAQVADLDGRGPRGEYARPAVGREASEVDRDIDFQFSREKRHFLVALTLHVDELIEGRRDPLAQCVVRVRPE